jgi:hypothetical protein
MSIKELLISSIRKNFLDLTGVDDYYIFWKVEDRKIKLGSYAIAHKSSTLSIVEVDPVFIPNSSALIRDPGRLLKMLAITNDNLKIEIADNKMKLSDDAYDLEFILCDQSTVGIKLPLIEEPLSYDIILEINDDFANKFISAKNANSSEIVSVEVKDRKAKFELGETNGYSNKIKFSIELDGMFEMEKILFSSDIIEEIFKRNKNSNGKLYVCEDGLMMIEYQKEEIKSKYFLVALDKL